MRHFRPRAALIAGLSILLLLAGTASLAAQEEGQPEIGIWRTIPGGSAEAKLELLAPIQDVLSGSVSLYANGILSLPTPGNFSKDLSGGGGSIGGNSPILQAGGGAALVPYRDPSPKFSRNVLLTRDFSHAPLQTEPSIAANPKDSDHLVVGVIDYNFPGVTSYVSFDGGTSWDGPGHVPFPRDQLASAGDPVVAFNSDGAVRYASISLDLEEFRFGPFFGEVVVSSIVVARSDEGKTWSLPVRTDERRRVNTQILPGGSVDQPRGFVFVDFLDKPWFRIGPHPDADIDVLYVTYTVFRNQYNVEYLGDLAILVLIQVESVIEMVHSEDGGSTWSGPLEVSPRVLQTFGSESSPEGEEDGTKTAPEGQEAEGLRRVVQGSSIGIAPDGTLYIAWMDTTDDRPFEGTGEIYVVRSDDGGESITDPKRIAITLEPPFRPRANFFRFWASAFPQVGAGPDGNVYIAFTAIPSRDPEDDGDLFLVRSDDRGETWTRPEVLNDDKTGRLQFFPSLDVDPKGGVHVMWGDMRLDPKQTEYHIYYTSSEDDGETWATNTRVSDAPSNPNFAFPGGRFIGDYFSLEATDDDIYMVWADSRLGNLGTVNQKIGFARQRLMPRPEVFISPPQGPGGQDVIIQGFNFQPDQNVFVSVAGSIVATERTNEEGRLTVGLFLPVAGQGGHEVRVFDASGNVASGSFFMEFGFGDIEELTEPIQELPDRITSLETELTAALAQLTPLEVPGDAGGGNNNGLLIGLIALAGVQLVVLAALAMLLISRRSATLAPERTDGGDSAP